MQIPDVEYFSYVIPAVVSFIFGLHWLSNNLKGEILDQAAIKSYVARKKDIPYILIAIGFISGLIANIFSTGFDFVLYLLDSFKYIGVFMLILGEVSLTIIPLILVFGSIILSSIGQGMFHDLLIWVIFLAAVIAMQYRPKASFKAIFVFAFIIFSISIQLLKSDIRGARTGGADDSGLNTLTRAYEQSLAENAFFSLKALAESNLRINQGYIITHIMKTVPLKEPFANGSEMNEILTAAILPRFLAPDKLTAGNREIFMKYTHFQLKKNTSMGLSSVGDAYINFGITGGCIFMFLLGLLYNEILKAFHRFSRTFPVLLLFAPMVFYYAIRPDSELQTNLGHLVKACFLIYVVFWLWKNDFKFFNFWRRSLS